MKLSTFGQKFAGRSGVVQLMDDLGSALADNPEMIFMGGGNPGRLPGAERLFREALEAILADPDQRHSLFGIYQSPKGDRALREQMAGYLRGEFGWSLGPENIAVSNGSQAAFFLLFNMLGGRAADGTPREIHLPLAPEYIGYADVGVDSGLFTATRPQVDLMDNQLFKYRVDFSQLALTEHTAALCVSRPTNPTGNVLTDDEVAQLDAIARQRDIPLIIDGAYGLPFPGIVFEPAQPHWNDNTILVLSLSKLGLPGARTGIIVASEALIEAFTNANTILSLACGTIGPALAGRLLASGQMQTLCRDVITPFYRERSAQTLAQFQRALAGLPCRIHKPEGAIFLWLWFEGLPISSEALYQRLKARGVLVVPGENFFVGLDASWTHQHECIRVSYAQDAASVQRGVDIIAEEVRRAYAQA